MSMRFRWKLHVPAAAGLFLLFWFGDACIDVIFFRGGASLANEIFAPEPAELWMRCVSSSLLALLFLSLAVLMGRQRSAANSARQSDELSRIFFESSNDAICLIEADGLTITGANGVFLRRHSLTEAQAPGLSFADLVSREGRPDTVLALVAQAVASASLACGEISYPDADGQTVYEELSVYPISDAQGGIERVLHLTRDITAGKLSEARLKESEQRYRAIFENTGTAMAITQPDGTLSMVNKGFEAMTGYSRTELEGRLVWTDFICDEYRERMMGERDLRWGGSGVRERCFELKMKHRLGIEKPVVGNWAAIGESRETVISLQDITVQKQVEDALRQSQATLALAQRIASLGNWEWDLISDTLTWSEEVYRIFGVDPETPVSYEVFLRAVHPDDREALIKAVNNALYNMKPYLLDHRVVLPGGALRTLSSRAEVTFDAQGRPQRMVGTTQDVTWRHEAELALRASEEKFSKAFHASPDSIVITRAEDGTYIDVNEAFQEMTGYTREEVMGHSSTELKLWADPEARMVMLKLLNQYGHVRNLDVRFRVKSGEIRELLWSADVIEYQGEACLIAISRDVTDQRHLEKELLESDAKLYMKHEELKNLFHQMEGIRREWEETMDCISDMFILSDQWGRIRRFNRAVETFTGKAHRDIVGRECLQFLEDQGLKAHLQAPGTELLHQPSGKWFVLKRYAFPTTEVDGSTREVVIINDTTGMGRNELARPKRLVEMVRKTH